MNTGVCVYVHAHVSPHAYTRVFHPEWSMYKSLCSVIRTANHLTNSSCTLSLLTFTRKWYLWHCTWQIILLAKHSQSNVHCVSHNSKWCSIQFHHYQTICTVNVQQWYESTVTRFISLNLLLQNTAQGEWTAITDIIFLKNASPFYSDKTYFSTSSSLFSSTQSWLHNTHQKILP
jgi:hypothetical protein